MYTTAMKRLSIFLLLVFVFCHQADASIIQVFKDEDGHTKWQHVANFSASVLILLLSFTLAGLITSLVKLRKRNKTLADIRRNLEKTVQKRTENLNHSNQLLLESNKALEGEIGKHKETSELLLNSQNFLSSILASMPSMLLVLNENHEITHWNKTAESISGLKQGDVIGKRLWDAYPAITLSPDQVQGVLDDGNIRAIKHSQRGQYYFDITIYPLGAETAGVVIVVENVTQRSLAENMLIQRDKLASVGEMAATMAFDLHNPLDGIIEDIDNAISTLQQKPNETSSLPALLLDAQNRGKQAQEILQNLLSFSDSQGLELQEHDVTEIIEHSLELGENMLSDDSGLHFREIEVVKKYDEQAPKIACYSAELQQVFLSLFRHACHALGEKTDATYTPTITIEVLQAYDNTWVKIQHNGKGLSTPEQQDIFEPIVQQTTPNNPKPIRAEHRLSFPYFIVTEHHNGHMALTSDIDVGTTFHMEFPASSSA